MIVEQWVGEVVLLLLIMLGLIVGLLGWGICALVELRIKLDIIEGRTRDCWRDPRCRHQTSGATELDEHGALESDDGR